MPIAHTALSLAHAALRARPASRPLARPDAGLNAGLDDACWGLECALPHLQHHLLDGPAPARAGTGADDAAGTWRAAMAADAERGEPPPGWPYRVYGPRGTHAA